MTHHADVESHGRLDNERRPIVGSFPSATGLSNGNLEDARKWNAIVDVPELAVTYGAFFVILSGAQTHAVRLEVGVHRPRRFAVRDLRRSVHIARSE